MKDITRGRGCRASRLRSFVIAGGACKKNTDPALVIETAPVERRSIVLSAQANGTVEPIDIVEVKSKASGTITKMPVDVGSYVHVGDLLVQIDPRDVHNQYDQAAADVSSATVQRATALAQRNRSAELYKQKIITAQEMDQANLDFANADASLSRRGRIFHRAGPARGCDGAGANQRDHHRATGVGRDSHHVGNDIGERWDDRFSKWPI